MRENFKAMMFSARPLVVLLVVLCSRGLASPFSSNSSGNSTNGNVICVNTSILDQMYFSSNDPTRFPAAMLLPEQMAYFYTMGYQTNRQISWQKSRRKRSLPYPFPFGAKALTPPGTNPNLRTRKEIRQMTTTDWQSFYNAVRMMKTTFPGVKSTMPLPPPAQQLSQYDLFVVHLNQVNAPGSNRGAAFLPFHRELLYRFELALEAYNPRISLPYWDSSLDESLPEPADSVVWTPQLFGNGNGNVTTGPFANFSTTAGCQSIGSTLQRAVTSGQGCLLMSADKIQSNILSKTNFSGLLYPQNPNVEYNFASVLKFVGGHGSQVACAGNDPVFWLIHSFVDLLWEEFRIFSQTTDLQRDYPSATANHAPFQYMLPFTPMLNINGLGPQYNLSYQYSVRPSKLVCAKDSDCASQLLWCDTTGVVNTCVSKIRRGGKCGGLPDNACDCSLSSASTVPGTASTLTSMCYIGTCICISNSG